jgi:hypothetical protein
VDKPTIFELVFNLFGGIYGHPFDAVGPSRVVRVAGFAGNQKNASRFQNAKYFAKSLVRIFPKI